MASIRRRRMLDAGARRARGRGDSGPRDITDPHYLLRPALGARTAKRLSGAGIIRPGYTIIGTQRDALAEGLVPVRVVKMVSPLTGQGPADPRATGRYYGMNYDVLPARIVRQRKAVPPNTGSKVVRPPRTAIRRMNTRGQGTVEYW